MQVADFMTRRVLTVTPDTPILAAARLMLEHKISGLPVVDAPGHVVGIVSEQDLLRRHGEDRLADGLRWLAMMIEPEGLAGQRTRFDDGDVSAVMARNPVTIAPGASLKEASRLIEEHAIKRLPVVENGILVGIIARADLVRALAQSADRARVAVAHDVSVTSRLAELERQIWRDRARLSKPF
jgi:CBS domain-containing protein